MTKIGKTAKIIKDFYIEKPLTLIENKYLRDGRAEKLQCLFEIKTVIWIDQNLPEYKVAIPENLLNKSEVLEHWDALSPIEYTYVTYVSTGRAVYDNTKPKVEAIVYEYRLKL